MEVVHFSQLLAATGVTGAALEQTAGTFARVCLDSRQVRPGDVFWALKGDRHDGHDFVGEARQRGAALCVVEQGRAKTDNGPAVAVRDTLAALGDFARWYRYERDALVIGVTGSVGKTTAREMIHAALSPNFSGVRSQHNYNNEIGLPVTLLDIEEEHDFAVLEMGATKLGDIRSLTEIASPEIGVITAIGPAHLESFGDLGGVMQAKGELFEALPATGFAVLPGDIPDWQSLAARAPCSVLLVGEQPHNDFQATDVELGPMQLKFKVDGARYEVPVAGRHALTAALAAIAVCREVGMQPQDIRAGLLGFTPAPGRCRVEYPGTWTVIDDTYNSNPASILAACETLRDWPGGCRKLLVTGDMLELEKYAAAYHRELGGHVARARIDRLIAYGRHAVHVVEGAWSAGVDAHCLAECTSLDAVLTVLDCWLDAGDVVLVKGSRGMQMERVVEWIRIRSQEEISNQTARGLARACV